MIPHRRVQIVDVPQFLRELGIKGVKDSGSEVAFCCPFHGDNDPSASMNKATTAWLCFGCHEKGNAYTLAKRMGGERPEIRNTPSGDDDLLAYVHEMTREVEPLVAEPEPEPISYELLGMFRYDWRLARSMDETPWRYLRSRFPMLGEEAILNLTAAANLGFDFHTSRITIPIWDHRGLWGFKARSITKSLPRYIALGGEGYPFRPYKSGDVLFLNRMNQEREVVIVEGEFNALVTQSALLPLLCREVVGVSGSVLTNKQAQDIILSRPTRVVLYFDDDLPGATGAWHASQILSGYVEVATVGPHERDACDSRPEEIRRLVYQPVDPLLRLIGERDPWAEVSKTH